MTLYADLVQRGDALPRRRTALRSLGIARELANADLLNPLSHRVGKILMQAQESAP